MEAKVALHDLTGFEGRCDAVLFSKDPAFIPPTEKAALAKFRRAALGLPDEPEDGGEFDLVVVGGGIAGTSTALWRRATVCASRWCRTGRCSSRLSPLTPKGGMVGYQLLVIGYQLSPLTPKGGMVDYQLFVVDYQLSPLTPKGGMVDYQLLVVACRLLVFNNKTALDN